MNTNRLSRSGMSLLTITLAAVVLLASSAGAPLLSSAQTVAAPSLGAVSLTTATLGDPTERVSQMKLINYYPSNDGWSAMWTNWHPVTIAADMHTAAALGANSIRIIVFPSVTGWPTTSATMEGRLQSMFSMASSAGLTVQLTLFDHWYKYSDLSGSKQWTDSVLEPIANSTNLASVEVQNEVTPSNSEAITWVRSELNVIKAVIPNTLTTVSATGGLAGMLSLRAAIAPSAPDVWDLHYYGNSQDAYATFTKAKAAVAPLPLLVGEGGLATITPTSDGRSTASNEDAQNLWLKVVEYAALAAGLPPVAPWTLYDFTVTGIPYNTTGKLPNGIDVEQYGYGLYRSDHTPKPAVATVKAAFNGTLEVVTPNSKFNAISQSDSLPAEWKSYCPSGVMTVEPTQGINGTNALMFSDTIKPVKGTSSFYTIPMQPVIPGQTWTASVWAHGTSATGQSDLTIAWYSIGGHWLGNSTSQPLHSGTTSWTQLTLSTQAPPGSAAAWVSVRSGGNNGTVWFSDPTWAVS